MTTRGPTYKSWQQMRHRCNGKNYFKRHRYGGRGIKCCERWNSYANFLSDMGERPAGMTLDRVNNDGDYEPSNCRWADARTQLRNKGCNKLTWEAVEKIRATYVRGVYGYGRLARDFGVSRGMILLIIHGKNWTPTQGYTVVLSEAERAERALEGAAE
jgi:hypothetical protein